MIEIKGLDFSYDRRPWTQLVLKQLEFMAQPGECIGLIGANGAGKSTLLKLLVGLHMDYDGQISVCGLPLKKQNLNEIRRRTGYVFQDSDSQLFLSTVYEDTAFGPRNLGLSQEEVKARTMEALKKVHMEENKDKQNYRLSGGQKKLASIATILSLQPEMILLDEPSAALDPRNRRNLTGVLNELPVMKIIASHDLDFIYDTCERVILISGGQIAADGPAGAILTDQKLLEAHGLELPLSFSRNRK